MSQQSQHDKDNPGLTQMLRKVSTDIELDAALTLSDVINLYITTLRRIANRATLGPEDAIRILHINQTIAEACAAGKPEHNFDFVNNKAEVPMKKLTGER